MQTAEKARVDLAFCIFDAIALVSQEADQFGVRALTLTMFLEK
jgi:hypothetical protein